MQGYPSVWDAFDEYRKRKHGKLVEACVKKLKAEGYRILGAESPAELSDVGDDDFRYIASKYGFSYREMARHDITAEKDGQLLFVEVSTSDKIAEQVVEAKKKGKVIVVFPIEDAKGVQVLGCSDLGVGEC